MHTKPLQARLLAMACLLLAGLQSGCQRPAAATTTAKPEAPRNESELGRTTISRAAQKSLGLQTTPVRVEMVQEHRLLTGWIMVRPGADGTVSAPVGGYLRAPAAPAKLPAPGQRVEKGQELFRLEPVLAPLEQTQLAALRRGIESDLTKAREDVTVAVNELKHIEELFKTKLRSDRDVQQARAQVKKTQEDLSAAEDKLKVITAPGADKNDFRPPPQTLSAPCTGVTLTVLASPGQFVPAAAPLVQIADLSQPWVRVPVPEFDLPRVDRKQPAEITVSPEGLTGRGSSPSAGKPQRLRGVSADLVPQVDLLKHTADLIYKLEPLAKGDTLPADLVKDQMVSVAVPIGIRSEEAIVPYAAVVFDAYGGSWIYIDRTAKDAETCVYERVRVELGAPLGNDVAVRPALKAGDAVVSDGAAALFSREFYRPPVAVPEAPKGKN
jgi:multidrug efflux pump subunit AcrA (membrane-fusion protein)